MNDEIRTPVTEFVHEYGVPKVPQHYIACMYSIEIHMLSREQESKGARTNFDSLALLSSSSLLFSMCSQYQSRAPVMSSLLSSMPSLHRTNHESQDHAKEHYKLGDGASNSPCDARVAATAHVERIRRAILRRIRDGGRACNYDATHKPCRAYRLQ